MSILGRSVTTWPAHDATSTRALRSGHDGADPIILIGTAELVEDEEILARLDVAYGAKYVDPHSGAHATIFVEGDVAFRIHPRS